MPRLPRAALIGGVVGLLLALLLGAGVGPSAQGIVAQAAGTLTLLPTSGAPGTHVFMNAGGFTPGEKVEAIWNYSGPGTGILQKSFYEYNPTVVADANGNALTSFWVSAAAAGNYGVAAVGLTSGTVAIATYQLTPSVDIGASIGAAGATLRFTGWAFGAREAIQVYWDYQQPDQALAAKASTDSKGDWGGKTFVTPSNATTGAHTITAVGQTSGVVATATYTVGAAPQGAAPGASDWATFGYDLQNTRVNPTETTIGVGNVATLAPKWAEMTPFTPVQKTVASPVVANGVVYLGTTEGQLLAYDLSGNLLWSFNATAPIYGSPAVGNGIVYFGTVKTPNEAVTGNYIYALNASTGALVWENFLSFGSLWSPPTYYNGVVYAEAAQKEGISGGFYAFDALSGATVWSISMPSGNWSVPVFDPSGANLYMATGNPCVSSPPQPWNTPLTDGCSGSLFDLNPATGATVWTYKFPDYSGDDDAPATPVYAVVNGTPELFEGVKNGIFYCLNATTGALVWQVDTGNRGDNGIYSSAAYYNGVLYFGGYKTLYALNASDGSVALTFSRQPVGTIVSSPAIANGVLYVTTESGNLVMYNVATGAWIRTIFFPIPGSKYGYTIYGSPVVSNGVVYVPVSDGNLYAFSPNGQ